MSFLGRIAAVVARDVRAEVAGRELTVTTLVFSVLVLVMFTFLLPAGGLPALGVGDDGVRVGAGLLWVVWAFAAELSLARTFAAEQEAGALDGLLLSPVDGAVLFAGKTFAAFLALVCVQGATLFVFAVLLGGGLEGARWWAVLGLGVVGAAAFSAVGCLLSALTMGMRGRSLITAILFLGLQSPVLLAGAVATGELLAGRFETAGRGAALVLAGFALAYGAAGALLFETVVEE